MTINANLKATRRIKCFDPTIPRPLKDGRRAGNDSKHSIRSRTGHRSTVFKRGKFGTEATTNTSTDMKIRGGAGDSVNRPQEKENGNI